MPEIGDTRLDPVIFTALPEDNEVGVSVSLSEITYLLRIQEYIDPGGGADWFSGAFVAITSVGSMSLTESPDIDNGTLTFEISSPFTYAGTITIPVDSALSGSTEYTWQVNLNITHGTLTFGEVTRNYDTVQVSFTTEAAAPPKPVNPTPSDTDTGIVLFPTLSWQAG